MNVGIDLGTSYCLISRIGSDGAPELIPDFSEQDLFHTPSQVFISADGAVVGRAVDSLLEQTPDLEKRVLRFFKRQLGTRVPLIVDEKGRAWYPETVAALILRKLKLDAESAAGKKLKAAVITVPAHFNDPQRQAVIEAAMIADIPLLGLIEEPIAAALHYGVKHKDHDRTLLTYDFGGGTFDSTVLTLNSKGLYVLSKAGLTDVGGKEVDDRIVNMIYEQFEKALRKPMSSSALIRMQAQRLAEEIKIDLSLPGHEAVRKPILLGGEAVEVVISRAEFNLAIESLIDRTIDETLRCIRDAGFTPKSIDTVLLVGGSSLIPRVYTRIRELFSEKGQEVRHHEPSKAVALGAALYAAKLSGEGGPVGVPDELRGVAGYNLGIKLMTSAPGKVVIDTLIKKNSHIPRVVKKRYYTGRADQSRIVFEIVQYREKEDITSLGQLIVGPFTTPRLNRCVELTIEYRDDGTVSAQAFDAETGLELSQQFSRAGGDTVAKLAVQRALVRSTLINFAG